MSLTDRVHALYARHQPHFWPHVGAAFREPTGDVLRVMTVGINAYAGPDWSAPDPDVLRRWFVDRHSRFAKGVRSQADALAAHLTAQTALFEGLRYLGVESVFHTNAVKTWVAAAVGKKSDHLPDGLLAEHAPAFHAELALMAEHGAMPHVVMIFGEPFWEHAWRTFSEEHVGAVTTRRAQHFPGTCLHHVNRYTLALPSEANAHELLLVRVRHPAARTRRGSVAWLLAQPDFRVATTGGP